MIKLSEIKKGDVFYEEELGNGIFCQAREDAYQTKEADEIKWQFKADLLEWPFGEVDYLSTDGMEHYGPKIQKCNPRRVVCAACLDKKGNLIVGPRHFDFTMTIQIKLLSEKWSKGGIRQGFIDQYGCFMDRKEAWEIAEKNGQILRSDAAPKGKLYSEHLY